MTNKELAAVMRIALVLRKSATLPAEEASRLRRAINNAMVGDTLCVEDNRAYARLANAVERLSNKLLIAQPWHREDGAIDVTFVVAGI